MDASVWYYVVNGEQVGPVPFAELKAAATGGKLTAATLVWQEGTSDWVAARTVAGLFPVTPTPPPAPASPSSDAAYPIDEPPAPPLPLDDEPVRPTTPRRPARAEPLSLDDAPEPLPPRELPEWVKLAGVFVRRALGADPRAPAPTPDEGEALTAAGVMDPTARKLAVWRRSVLFVAAVPCLFAALFALIDVVAMGKEERGQYSAFGLLVMFVQALSVSALPAAAILGALTYTRLSVSAKWVLAGGLVAFAVPLGAAFVPADWLLDSKTDSTTTVDDAAKARMFSGMILGVQLYLTLVPLVLSLLPAVARACVRLKLLLPESLVPGWGLATSAPLCVLLTLATFVLLYHVVGNMLLLIGLVLWVGAPLLYLTRFGLLTRPVTSPADRATLVTTSLGVLGLILLGMCFLVVFLFTAKFGGMTLLGFDEAKSLARPWSLDLHRVWIEYAGRSLFLTVFFADLLVRVALSVWREERAFAGSPEAAGFDRTMTGLSAATLPRGG